MTLTVEHGITAVYVILGLDQKKFTRKYWAKVAMCHQRPPPTGARFRRNPGLYPSYQFRWAT